MRRLARHLFTLFSALPLLPGAAAAALCGGGCYTGAVNAVYAKGGQTVQEGLIIPSTAVDFRGLGADLTDEDLRELLPHLNALRAFYLSLSDTAVTDASVPTLLRLRHVWGLDVTGTAMTPQGLSGLKGLRTLDALRVGRFDAADLRALRDALPPRVELRAGDGSNLGTVIPRGPAGAGTPPAATTSAPARSGARSARR